MGVSGIQSNYAETPYGDIRNTEQAIACHILSPGLDGLKVCSRGNLFAGSLQACLIGIFTTLNHSYVDYN